ncbi:MAG TPA: hypothetical protein VF746_27745 [Longimicrobium sp.]|jgi:hypothetical protein
MATKQPKVPANGPEPTNGSAPRRRSTHVRIVPVDGRFAVRVGRRTEAVFDTEGEAYEAANPLARKLSARLFRADADGRPRRELSTSETDELFFKFLKKVRARREAEGRLD